MVVLLAGCNQDVQVTRNPPPAPVVHPIPPPPPPPPRPPDTTATLTWEAPTTNTDGTPITDLAGYHIYYGTASGNYTTTIDVGVGQLVYVIDSLPQGHTYYFAITALNAEGIESDKSAEVSKAIQ